MLTHTHKRTSHTHTHLHTHIHIGPPSIITGPVDKIRREQDEVTFMCFATGDPVPTVSWTFNDTILNDSSKYSIGKPFTWYYSSFN